MLMSCRIIKEPTAGLPRPSTIHPTYYQHFTGIFQKVYDKWRLRTADCRPNLLVNKLVAVWYTRVKYVDDLSVLECIPRCSPSYMPCIANEIAQYASDHGMRLNAKKCKEIMFSFLQYQPFPATPLCLSGRVIERVGHYKLLGYFFLVTFPGISTVNMSLQTLISVYTH